MHIEILAVGAFASNCVLLWDRGPEAWVFDPGAEAPAILEALSSRGLRVVQVVLTHGHIDHLSALDAVLAAQPAPVAMHAADAAWAFSPANRLPPYLRVPARPAGLTELADDAVLEAGGLSARVLHTPGHSPGCICLHFAAEGLLVTGDTLFAGSIGRTDFRGGDARAMERSLARLAALPGETTVIPGHGPSTTIADECRENPYLLARQ